jgi:AsmA-like C-terminal region/AsmA family
VNILSSKKRWLAAAAIVLLLFLLRPGASRLKSRIIVSMSSAIGRSVDIGSVRLQLLPRPGFELDNLVVYDDPAFGAEPMLRASEVTAVLRLTSLARGRIEIARLELTEPSLNLVHGENGRWNLEALVERTSHRPLAPTGKAKSESRPGFPYIEATSARINFKNGAEKKPFALTNADFSLWQDSENSWGVRMKAQPVRSDMNLNDTGILRVNGTWQRAATLRETPMDFSVEWDGAQLGQLTKMITRTDQGWRGGAQLAVHVAGTPVRLAVSTNLSIQDFRRYDITNGEQMRLAAACAGEYSSLDHGFREVMCNAPVGGGLITLKGEMGFPGSRRYGLVLMAEDVPASAVAALAQRVKKNLPEDLLARGIVRGSLTVDETPASSLRLDGQGELAGLHLTSVANKAEIGADLIPFAFASSETSTSNRVRKNAAAMRFPDGPHFEIGPFSMIPARANGSSPMIRGWISRAGYSFAIAGDAEIGRTLRLARVLGMPALNSTAEGSAQLDLRIAGVWPDWNNGSHADFVGPQITGTAKLRNAKVSVRGIGAPVEIAAADLELSPEKVRAEKVVVDAAGASWTGSLEMPRGCGTPGACNIHFNLNADRIRFAELTEWTSPHPNQQPWYHAFSSDAQPQSTFLGSLRASGRISADRFVLHGLTANHVSANLSVDRGKLKVSELTADFLGGKHLGSWQADFSVKPAVCEGRGSFAEVALSRLADEMKMPGMSGKGNGSYELSGPCARESESSFWTRAKGVVQFDIEDGTLPRFSLTEGAEPLQIASLSGQAQLHDGRFEMKEVKLDSSNGNFQVSGSASLKQALALKLERRPTGSAVGYDITGTLIEPRIETTPPTEQARLKTVPAKASADPR